MRLTSGVVRPIDGAEDAIAALRAEGVLVCLTTGFSPATLAALLDALGWHDRADLALAPGPGVRGRPHPDLVLGAVLRLGIDDVRRVAVAATRRATWWPAHGPVRRWSPGSSPGRTTAPRSRRRRTRTCSSRSSTSRRCFAGSRGGAGETLKHGPPVAEPGTRAPGTFAASSARRRVKSAGRSGWASRTARSSGSRRPPWSRSVSRLRVLSRCR